MSWTRTKTFDDNFLLDIDLIHNSTRNLVDLGLVSDALKSQGGNTAHIFLGKIINNDKLACWMCNALDAKTNDLPILTDHQRQLCRMLAGPHALTILKALELKIK